MAKEVKTVRAAALSVGIFMMTGAAGAAPVFLGPTAYLGFPDSPFSGGSFSYFHFDNFESGILSTAGVAVNPGIIVPALEAKTGSIDAIVDGWASSGPFNASSLALGVGGIVTFEAFNPSGVSVGSTGAFTLGDCTTLVATAEDPLFDGIDAAGLSAIDSPVTGTSDRQVDHLQYGASTAIPQPGTYSLAITGVATLPFIRRRRLGPVPFE